MGLLCNSSADGRRMIAWLFWGLRNRIFSPTVALLLNSCGLFLLWPILTSIGKTWHNQHEPRLYECFKTQLLLRVQRSALFSSAIQLQNRFYLPNRLQNVPSPSPLQGCLVSFFEIFSLHIWFCSQTRPLLGSCLGPGHSYCVLHRLSRWTPRNPHRPLV